MTYIIAGFVPNALIVLPIGIVLMIGTLLLVKLLFAGKAKDAEVSEESVPQD